MNVVVKIGGHVFPSRLDVERVSAYAEMFKKLKREGHRVVVVTGGGEGARKYINTARALGGSELLCDLMGIHFSRLNARLLIASLGEDAYSEPPTSVEELRRAFETGKIVVLGGLQPGQSTNAVGIISAEAVGADLFINATDVDGVYTADPKKDPRARRMDVVGADKLLKMVLATGLEAGGYELFDPLAVMVVKRSGIPTRIIDGREVENIERAVRGERIGTLITP
ncbi:MAG: UMP kinase [Candidatus Bathyarchaeia archaeon]